LFTIERLLREGSATGNYIYRPSRNTSDLRNISSLVQKSIEDYTRFTVAPLVTENFPDIENVDFIVITGGGANIIDKAALLDEIGQDYFDRLVFITSSELANVRGFYKYAVLIWNGSGEIQSPERVEPVVSVPSQEVVTEEVSISEPNPDYSEQLKQVQDNLKRLREEIDQEI
ncbi:MAG: hypothetical protein WAX09_04790, partial [Lactococcus chungangensis]